MDQARWNTKGKERLAAIHEQPHAFHVARPPRADEVGHGEVLGALTTHSDARVLELGAGFGEEAVYLAKQGATVVGTDIGFHLVAAALELAALNSVGAWFLCADARALPFVEASFEEVFGIDVLHHLSPPALLEAVAEAHRVVCPGGRVRFLEPIENSRLFDQLQKLIPAGKKGSGYYRPSRLSRSWKAWVAAKDDRPLTTGELMRAGASFDRTETCHVGLLVRLTRILGEWSRAPLNAVDRFLLRWAPPLRRFAHSVLVTYSRST